ncbi:MAG: hypothetical protein NWS47_03965 [Alphaproteobacteria bacterium]|nr:hypothetical protein [Alphaproteobacteria bacterium]
MKKIMTLAAILAATPAFVFASAQKNEVAASSVVNAESPTTIANKGEPHTAVPAAQSNRDKRMHDSAKAKASQKTQAEYAAELQKRINEAKAFVEKKKSSVPALQFEQASMKIRVAEEWLKAIKSYKDPLTRYVRSFNYGMSEAKSAKKDMEVHKARKDASDDVVKNGLLRLSKQSEALLAERKDVTFCEENDICFNTMLKSSLEYITLATKPEAKPNFKHLTKRARRYLSDAKKFLRAHKSRKNKKEKNAKADAKVAPATAAAPVASK